MRLYCQNCDHTSQNPNEVRSDIVRNGSYYRTSDGRRVRRYYCNTCESSVSPASRDPFYRQRKRHKNRQVEALLSGGMSQNRAAKVLKISRRTLVKKFRLMSALAKTKMDKRNRAASKATVIEFDDLETFEHTKCKPLSVTVAVEHKTRRILGIEVSRMPAKGPLKRRAEKYGYRRDERRKARKRLLRGLQDLVDPFAEIKSDSNPHYPKDVKQFFPNAVHKRYLGKRGSLGGQGELKKVKFDPLFSLNHTCAKMRADINRLIRKTWSTTKRMDQLEAHLHLFANYHNKNLPPPDTPINN